MEERLSYRLGCREAAVSVGMCVLQRMRQSHLALHADDKDERLRTDYPHGSKGHKPQAICFSPVEVPDGSEGQKSISSLGSGGCAQAFK